MERYWIPVSDPTMKSGRRSHLQNPQIIAEALKNSSTLYMEQVRKAAFEYPNEVCALGADRVDVTKRHIHFLENTAGEYWKPVLQFLNALKDLQNGVMHAFELGGWGRILPLTRGDDEYELAYSEDSEDEYVPSSPHSEPTLTSDGQRHGAHGRNGF